MEPSLDWVGVSATVLVSMGTSACILYTKPDTANTAEIPGLGLECGISEKADVLLCMGTSLRLPERFSAALLVPCCA